MLSKRIIIILTFYKGILFRTKKFVPDYRYTHNFIGNKSIDEIILLDVSRDLKYRNLFYNIIHNLKKNCFVPISVGGMINEFNEIRKFQKLGADKIIINSLFSSKPELVEKIIRTYGSQFVIAGIDLKKINKEYQVHVLGGQKKINFNFELYVKKILDFRPGEILVQSIDRDGSLMGYDLELIKKAKKICKIPLLVAGGAGSWEHFEVALKKYNVDGACTSNIYHFSEQSIKILKKHLKNKNIHVR